MQYIMAVVWAAILIAFAALFTEFTVKVKWVRLLLDKALMHSLHLHSCHYIPLTIHLSGLLHLTCSLHVT